MENLQRDVRGKRSMRLKRGIEDLCIVETGKVKRIRVLLLAVAAGLIGVGIYFGGYMDSFANAVRICLECIGIG